MKNFYTSYFRECLNLGFNESVHSTLESFKSIVLDVRHMILNTTVIDAIVGNVVYEFS